MSNEKIRRVDIGIESTTSQQDTLLPYQLLRDPNLCTALAWDNFYINISILPVAFLCTMHLAYATRMNLKLQENSSREKKQ